MHAYPDLILKEHVCTLKRWNGTGPDYGSDLLGQTNCTCL